MKTADVVARIALVIGSLVFSLAILEVGCRVIRSGPQALSHWPNLVRARMEISEDGSGTCSYAYDDTVGWTLPPNCSSTGYNIGADGFRFTPATSPLHGAPILATGSSFTQGAEVTDGETWATYLQNLAGRPVLNAGVSGYSLDQTVLRTQQAVPKVKPVVVVASFTPDDIRRSELKVAWSRQKPYFALKDGGLELRNVPVPGRPHEPVPIPIAARLFGWSVLMDDIVDRIGFYAGWFYDEVWGVPSGSGEEIACRMMPRLASVGVPVVVLAQYGRGHWMADTSEQQRELRIVRKVLDCAASAGLIPFDLSEPLKPFIESRGVDGLFNRDHHSAAGNRVVAELILKKLVQEHLLPPPDDR